ncbi:DedA family protein [Haliovirga abyssi]|uniref:Membrane protein n=1 Tax=Haliovirga abyssi TaxID=2996794 RepID=A0AAU9DPV9_9FUSO|nr:DedA family protein [Haliovirga abyssi]BDU50488.1 membrane protein [Haliovirga abyssi]
MLVNIFSGLMNIVGIMGYPGIIFFMALESSFVPFPSEVIIPPAGYLAAQGQMNLYLVIISGIIGSLMGSFLNYYIALIYGRKFVLKFGKYFGLTEKRFMKVEEYFNEHGAISTFIGRLITVVRQYISFPAGLTKMKKWKFALYTFLGAGLWNAVLAYIGYLVGNNLELIKKYSHKAAIYVIVISFVIIVIYIILYKNKKKNKVDK